MPTSKPKITGKNIRTKEEIKNLGLNVAFLNIIDNIKNTKPKKTIDIAKLENIDWNSKINLLLKYSNLLYLSLKFSLFNFLNFKILYRLIKLPITMPNNAKDKQT